MGHFSWWRRIALLVFLLQFLTAFPHTDSVCQAQSGPSIEGSWSMTAAVTYNGTLEFSRRNRVWVGRINLDGQWETLTNISFNPSNGTISFLRSSRNQHYSGRLVGNQMTGQFDNNQPWSADRSQSAVSAPTIEGTWSMTAAVTYHGSLQFTRAGNGWTGRLNLDGQWEPVTNISFDPTTGAVAFLRPSRNQHYAGRLAGNQMTGSLDNTAQWSADRSQAGSPPPATVAPPASIAGGWSITAAVKYHGKLQFIPVGKFYVGTVNLDGKAEPIVNISYDPKSGAISFVRSSRKQKYSGRVLGNQMEGKFDNTQPWSAKR